MKRTYRVKNRKKQKRARLAISILLLIVMLFSAYQLVRILIGYSENRRQYAEVAKLALSTPSPAPDPLTEPAFSVSPSELPVNVDFEALRAQNPEIVAWLYCEGTPISYPVMQTTDNEYYLTNGFDRSANAAGALFFDCRNNVSLPDENLIIYGHRMKDDSMFGTLPNYTKESYFQSHPTMYLLTEAQSYRVDIFSCRTVQAEAKYFETSFESPDAFARYLSRAASQSYWPGGLSISSKDRILTLVTCSTYTHNDDPRILVHGLLTPVH